MRRGSVGLAVTKLQTRLMELNLLPEGSNDGDFGVLTELAVKRFQSSNGLEDDGIVGALTVSKLYISEQLVVEAVPDFTQIDLASSIIKGGAFTWAEATRNGTRLPLSREVYNGMIRIATEAQKARDLIKQPFVITSWYRNPSVNANAGGASDSRHLSGDAIDFWVEGTTGDQLYALLDPIWAGGLGRYSRHPYLCHLDARDYRARWAH